MSDDDRKTSKGFAGLSSMVSDVDDTIAKASMAAPTSPGNKAGAKTDPNGSETMSGSQAPRRALVDPGSQRAIFAVGVIVVVALVGIFGLTTPATTVPSPAKGAEVPRPPQPVPHPDSLVSPSVAAASPSPPELASGYRPIQPTSIDLTFNSKPPIGRNNVLDTAQIQYCLAERIRMDSAQGAVDNRSEIDVDRLNDMVNDYNGRCGAFRYRRGTLESAKSVVERSRPRLEMEGRRRFMFTSSSDDSSPMPLDFSGQGTVVEDK